MEELRKMEETCKSCRHWELITKGAQEGFGECKSEKFIYGYPGKSEKRGDTLYYEDCETFGAEFVTGPDFGCIHYKKRKEVQHGS